MRGRKARKAFSLSSERYSTYWHGNDPGGLGTDRRLQRSARYRCVVWCKGRWVQCREASESTARIQPQVRGEAAVHLRWNEAYACATTADFCGNYERIICALRALIVTEFKTRLDETSIPPLPSQLIYDSVTRTKISGRSQDHELWYLDRLRAEREATAHPRITKYACNRPR